MTYADHRLRRQGRRGQPPRIEAAVVVGGKSTCKPHEAWIAVDPRGSVRVLMTGPDGFELSVGLRRMRMRQS
jgi:hypothetical protein